MLKITDTEHQKILKRNVRCLFTIINFILLYECSKNYLTLLSSDGNSRTVLKNLSDENEHAFFWHAVKCPYST
jgi:hypothetical protein